jgi:uncharacterized protein involved in exopolysaccharide biosynthesis
MTSWNPARTLGSPAPSASTLQQFLAVLARQRQPAMITFAAILGAVILFGAFLSDRYESRMEILVERAQLRRADPVMTGAANPEPIVNATNSASDETLNSEIALLRSQDVLRQVVVETGLDSRIGLWDAARMQIAKVIPLLGRPPQEAQDLRTAKAIRQLNSKLRIEVVKMSYVIAVSYRARNPHIAEQVLQALGNAYLKEHALAHHPPGELQFFQAETGQARKIMEKAEQQLVSYTRSGGVASGQIELESALRRLSDVSAAEGETRTSIAGSIRRISALESQAAQIPQRQVTELKTSDSAILLQQLKSSLLNLELRRTELLTKFQPTYPLVVEVDKQIAQARAALADAQRSEVQETTTNRDPTYEMVRADLSRSRAELATLQARSAALAQERSAMEARVQWLQTQTITQRDLMRNAKSAEDNYLALLHKQEEARISAQLDDRRIFNVSIVQAASNPMLPVHSTSWYLFYGCLLGMLGAFATATGADRLDPTVRTQEEVEVLLRTTVLASLPITTTALARIVDDHERAIRTRFVAH